MSNIQELQIKILFPLINDLNQRLVKEKEQQSFKDYQNEDNDNKKQKIVKLLLKSCVYNSSELFTSIKYLIDKNLIDHDLASFIDFYKQNIQIQACSYQKTKEESNLLKQRHKYLTELYKSSENDIQKLSTVHNPANNLEEIEFNKAKKTDKIERTFQQMVNDMVYLVDFLNRSKNIPS